MKTDPNSLKELIKKNPQVDADLLAKAINEAENIQPANDEMVSFNLHLPYSSDNYENSLKNSWDVI